MVGRKENTFTNVEGVIIVQAQDKIKWRELGRQVNGGWIDNGNWYLFRME